MKKIIKLIIALNIILCYSFCNAQTSAQWLAYQEKELKECAYIFEGKVIQQSGKSFTCSVIQITKIYRGSPQIKLSSIKMITTFGKNGSEKFPQLHNGSTYIIFGFTTSYSKEFQSIKADNLLTLQTNDWVTFIGNGAEWGWRKVTYYKTLDELYSFFKENGLTVQEEAEQK
jgi:hypothetical protein